MTGSITPKISVIKSVFFNSADPASDPEFYIETIKQLISMAKQSI
jgi:hypothetical protein